MRPITKLALDFISGVEADKHAAYRDQTGRWTIGRGHTGPEVHGGLTITQAQSDAYLLSDAVAAGTRIALCVSASRINALSEHQWSALVSFSFNLGFSEGVCPTLIKLLNAGNLDAAPAQMMRFDRAHLNGEDKPAEVVQGLYNRRAAEVALWKTADVPGSVAIAQASQTAPPPSSFTRDTSTPPSPNPVKPLHQQKSFVATIATSIAAVAMPYVDKIQGAASFVNAKIEPFAGGSDVLQHVRSELTVALAALAVISGVLLWLKNNQAKTQ